MSAGEPSECDSRHDVAAPAGDHTRERPRPRRGLIRNGCRGRALVKMQPRLLLTLVMACLLPNSASADWGSLADARGTVVDYPRGVFTTPASPGVPPGPVMQSADGRARLHVFTLPNSPGASPAEFIRRVVKSQERLTYKRIAHDFFVFSTARGGLILYRRCNFASDAKIHCMDVRYPQIDKRAWDGTVTRMSFSLRPR